MKLVPIVLLFSCAACLSAQTQARSSAKVAHNEGFLKLVNDAKSRIRQIDIEGYKKMLASGQKPVLVDVREDSEWDAGHAAGSVHIGKGVIERDIEAKVPEKNTKM